MEDLHNRMLNELDALLKLVQEYHKYDNTYWDAENVITTLLYFSGIMQDPKISVFTQEKQNNLPIFSGTLIDLAAHGSAFVREFKDLDGFRNTIKNGLYNFFDKNKHIIELSYRKDSGAT